MKRAASQDLAPGPAEFEALAERYQVVPVTRELPAGAETPVGVFGRLGAAEGSVLLEYGGYSYLGLDPVATLRVHEGTASWTGTPIGPVPDEPSLVGTLRTVARTVRAPVPAGLPVSPAGAFYVVGGDVAEPDGAVVLPGSVIVFDAAGHRLRLVVNVRAGQYDLALSRLDELAARLAAPPPPAPAPAGPVPGRGFDSEIPDGAYRAMIEAAHARVAAGELRQVTVSRLFHAPATVDPLTAYERLRVTNPSPYHYLARLPGVTLVGASPQGLVSVRDGEVRTYVIAGTRPRGEDTRADEKLAAELFADPKEREEHAMLVELALADLAGVASQVRVTERERLVRYARVMHLTTTVVGRLPGDRTGLDALAAVFPAGTVAGTPRDAALRVIEELEPRRRGLYGGAVGWLDFAGNLEACLGIRCLQFHSGSVYCQAGAGVVAGSVPELEVAESRAKASGLFAAVQAS
jgi:anthranilate synthase component 1